MKKITLFGGYHNSNEITINVNDKAYNALKNIKTGDLNTGEWVNEYLSTYQEKRLDNHFCGIDGCTCGSYIRAEIK